MTGRDLAEADDAPGGPDDFSALTPGSARSTLLTVLGEFVWPTGAPAWTSSLLYVLTGMGIETQTARQAIARGASAGWIEPERRGRAVMWSLTPAGRRIFEEGSPRVHSMSDPFSSWDGSWLILLVTIPHSHRTARKKLYAGLNWAGFGNPTPGVWLSPHLDRKAEVATLIEQLGLGKHTISFVGKSSDVGIGVREIVAQGWDLAALEEHYLTVLKTPAPRRPARTGRCSATYGWSASGRDFPFPTRSCPRPCCPTGSGGEPRGASRRCGRSGPTRCTRAGRRSTPARATSCSTPARVNSSPGQLQPGSTPARVNSSPGG
jgi:phenylacetic acid degradation operon negative regulatory protein